MGTTSSAGFNTFSRKIGNHEDQNNQYQNEVSFESDNTDLNEEFLISEHIMVLPQNEIVQGKELKRFVVDFQIEEETLTMNQPPQSPQSMHVASPKHPVKKQNSSKNFGQHQYLGGMQRVSSSPYLPFQKVGRKTIHSPKTESHRSWQDLSNRVQDAIRTAPPFAIIKLPAHSHIVVSGMFIKHPISIIGRPGTIIEIQNGNIVVDFREFLKKNPQYSQGDYKEKRHPAIKATISESSLIFKYELGIMSERVRALANGKKAGKAGESKLHISYRSLERAQKRSLSMSMSEGFDTDQGLQYIAFS